MKDFLAVCRSNSGQGATAAAAGAEAAPRGDMGSSPDATDSSSSSMTVTLLPIGAWSRVSITGSSIRAEAGVVDGLQEEASGSQQEPSSSSSNDGSSSSRDGHRVQHVGVRQFDGMGRLVATRLWVG